MSDERDMTPALGSPAGPASWTRHGERVERQSDDFGDARWSFLYDEQTQYATRDRPPAELVQEASRSARRGGAPGPVQGPVMHAPVWTWEVPTYFWFGGMAAGSAFVALACDLAGDERSARIARRVALGALMPSPPLLIGDLGRPERFYNMLRIFKPRSPMSMGVWALSAFGGLAAGSVGADLIGRRRLAQALGAANTIVGGYLGSYTGVLLAATAVPVWARSRLFLGPIFVATATATGAATTRLVLVATGQPADHRTQRALRHVENGAMAAELLLSTVNERRLGPSGEALRHGTAGRMFRAAKWLVRAGMGLRAARRAPDVASLAYMAAALSFRYAWIYAGKASATDDEVVARMARSRAETAAAS